MNSRLSIMKYSSIFKLFKQIKIVQGKNSPRKNEVQNTLCYMYVLLIRDGTIQKRSRRYDIRNSYFYAIRLRFVNTNFIDIYFKLFY